VVRTKLRDDLGWDNYAYEKKIKPVCDRLGWHHRMKPQKISTEQKQELKAAAGKCAKCGATEDLEIDHVWPRSLGGTSEADNLQVLCSSCNKAKGANV
jgi:5-methylcytosine-specific restriction endonuclease McrA